MLLPALKAVLTLCKAVVWCSASNMGGSKAQCGSQKFQEPEWLCRVLGRNHSTQIPSLPQGQVVHQLRFAQENSIHEPESPLMNVCLAQLCFLSQEALLALS